MTTLGQYIWYLIRMRATRIKLQLTSGPLDTSLEGLSVYVARDAQSRNLSAGWVVEVGAHNGIWQSSSFYFVQQGYNALLVEAAPEIFAELTDNMSPYAGKVKTVQQAVAPHNESWVSHFMRGAWLDGTDARVENTQVGEIADPCGDGSWGHSECVEPVSLLELLVSEQVPKRFFLLSLDIALGQDENIQLVRQIFESDFTPSYVV